MSPRVRLTVGRIRALRWLALGVAALFTTLLVVLWMLGRQAKVELPEAQSEPPKGAQQVGKGFDQTITRNGKPLLQIRGKRDRYDKENNLHVEEVLITAYQEDGSRYEVAADTATYNLEKKQAVLEGRVSLAGPQGFALRTRKLVLKQGGRWLDAENQVTFQWGTDPPLAGRSRELHAQLNRGEIVLSGGAGVRAMRGGEGEPFSLSANIIVFQRQLHQARADGKVLLKYGDSHLGCDRLAVHLSTEDNRLQFVRARWNVRAELHQLDDTGRPEFLVADGDSLSVLFDEAGKQPTRLDLEGDGKKSAHLRRGIERGEVFDLVAPEVEAEMAQGHLTSSRATGGVTVVNEGPGAPTRHLAARNAVAELAAGGALSRLELTGDVKVDEVGSGELAATRAVVTPDRVDAFGEPARLDTPRGQLRAPQLVYTREGALAHALGGVEATLPPGKDNPMRDTPLSEQREPVQVQAEEAFWRDSPRSFWFKGKVRAWSGDRVLQSDQLRGDADQQTLSAAGSVQTVWFMPPPKGEEGAKPASPQQVRVDAETLVYADREHRLVYDGNVRVVDGQRTLHSKTLTVDLTEKGEARRMRADGEVKLDAPAEGRSITADSADYDVQARQVVFRGSPVVLQDQKGGTLSGKQAVYSMADGKVRVTAEEEEVRGSD